MPVVIVEAAAPWASWRPPEALTYHRTLPLPPYTALVGILGAALGLDLPGAYRYVAAGGLRLGVGGWHGGQARDLWKFQKLELAAAGAGPATDVLLREHWVDSRLVLLVEAPDGDAAEAVADAYRRPAYPLTAGPSDALMLAVAVRVEDAEPRATDRLAHAMICREIGPTYKLNDDLADIPLGRIVRAPSVERLPTGFAFGVDGSRRQLGREPVTFVADPIVLDAEAPPPVVGYAVEPASTAMRSSYIYQTIQEVRPWVIPVHRYESPAAPGGRHSTRPSPSGGTPKGGRKKATGST